MKFAVTDPIIELRHVTMQREYRTVLRDVNLTVNRGDFMAITGPNGGGKTTLLRIILGLLRPTGGNVRFMNNGAPASMPPTGYLPQKNQIDSHFPITVREVVASGLLGMRPRMSRDESRARVQQIIDTIEMTPHADRPIGRLSGGQLQRTLLGRAIISQPELLVLDEPLSYIDSRFEQHIYDIIAQMSGRTTILLVSHQMSTIAAMANRHILVDVDVHECASSHHGVHIECEE